MNQRRSLTVVDAATPPAEPADRPPTPSEGDQLDVDIEALFKVYANLIHYTYNIDVDELRGAAASADCLVVGFDGEDEYGRLTKVIAAARRPATRKQIAQQLALLFAGFPAADKLGPVFTRLVAEDVGNNEPTIGALAAVTRKLRRTWRPEFGRQVPAIAEILAALEPEETRLARAADSLARMPELIAAARVKLGRLEAERESSRAEARANVRRRLDEGKGTDGWEDRYPGITDEVQAEMEAEERAT